MKETVENKPRLTVETGKFIEELEAQNAPPLYTLTPREAREVLLTAQSGKVEKPEAEIKDMEFPVGPTGKVDIRIARPAGKSGKLPVIFYIHGGGWVMGNKQTHDRLVRSLAAETGAAVVFANYTPSPEAQYPVPVEQCFAALKYMAGHAEELELDASKIAVAGDSVGGNMSAAMTLMAKRDKGPSICFQLLLYPVTAADFDTASYLEFADGPWLTRRAMQWFWDMYAPNHESRKEITASPLRATLEQLSGLPPALVITDRNDVLRDEGEAYAYKLMQAGVRTAAVRYDGTIHDFLMLDALADTAPAATALAQACAALKEHLFA